MAFSGHWGSACRVAMGDGQMNNSIHEPSDALATKPTDASSPVTTPSPASAALNATPHGPPPTAHDSRPTAHGPQPTAHDSLPTAHGQLATAPGQLPTAHGTWLRRADQAALASLVALGLLGTVAWWWTHGGPCGNLIELERLHPQRAEFLVDVNLADWPELAQLPDIGETLARRIVESRRRDGPFLRCEDLRRVKGIGPKRIERLRSYLVFTGEPKTPGEQ